MARMPVTALLLGPDQPALGALTVEALTPRLAIALSAGRHRKGYPQLDPNEDAVLAATDGGAALLAVADGHRGFEAAAAAIGAVADCVPRLLLAAGTDPRTAVAEGFAVARRAVAGAAPGWPEERRGSGTALTICAAGRAGGAAGTIGDSSALRCGPGGTRVLGRPTPFLTGGGGGRPRRARRLGLRAGDRLCVVTDGVADFLSPPWQRTAAELLLDAPGPAEALRSLLEAAGDGGAGDNQAAALWIG